MFGEMAVSYLYTYERYGWQVDEFSTYSSVTSFTRMIAQLILIPSLNLLDINESYILLVVLTSSLLRNIIKGAAKYPWMYYLGNEPNRKKPRCLLKNFLFSYPRKIVYYFRGYR